MHAVYFSAQETRLTIVTKKLLDGVTVIPAFRSVGKKKAQKGGVACVSEDVFWSKRKESFGVLVSKMQDRN